MHDEIILAYDRLAELKKTYAENTNAVQLIDSLTERVEADGLDSAFVAWVGKLIRADSE
ncbi:MAG: hypothetical protein LBG83_03930 [Oscillospiraceae bacterium]|jgi:hypothetical protein|nr:hypothetical protein [Oscillospiraceae bacterium]